VRPWLNALLAAATLAYPALVYAGLGHWNPLWMALLLCTLPLMRAWADRNPMWLVAAGGALLLGAAASLQGTWLPLKLYPVLVSTVLLVVFASSLRFPPTVIERIARLREPQLPASGVAYTRKVTAAWCVFFVANGCVSAATAVWGSDQLWFLYNGLFAYLLIGLFFGVEWTIRQRVRLRALHPHG
jgi:uncharacterized membrane protein